jgi:5-methylcytosine-specific restriction protein A
MPTRAAKPCTYPGCKALVRGVARCQEHKRADWRQDRAERGSSRERGYDTQWDKVRRAHLAAHPLCVQCKAEGRVNASNVEVDHIVPFRGLADPLRLDPANLQTLCVLHHERKHHRLPDA